MPGSREFLIGDVVAQAGRSREMLVLDAEEGSATVIVGFMPAGGTRAYEARYRRSVLVLLKRAPA